MANKPQPEEKMLFELAAIRQLVWRHAWSDDVLSAHERRCVERIDGLIDFVKETQARRHLAAAIVKGVETEDYLNRLAAPVGVKIVRLDTERQKRKVVRFPHRDEYA